MSLRPMWLIPPSGIMCIGCIAPAREERVGKGEEEAPVAAQDNEALVRRLFEEVWAKGNVAALDEFMAADYVEHTEHAVPPGSRPGRDSVKQRVALYYGAFPDWKVTIHDIFGRGDRVAYRWSASGTHLGEWAGIPPTGLHMTAGGITILRIAGGRFVEGWASLDISRSEEEQIGRASCRERV